MAAAIQPSVQELDGREGVSCWIARPVAGRSRG
jgi:hypothetical protein